MVKSRSLRGFSLATLSALLLASCASGDTASSDVAAASEEGFEYGAPQAEVDEIIADLEPVTLTYQPEASSPDGISAMAANLYKDEIESRSNGKISLDIVWGQAVASFDEIDDALVDGRVDIAYTAPIYHPGEYPTFDALSTITQVNTPSPLVGELASWATIMELGWNSPELLAEFTDKGLTPLAPVVTGGDYFMACNSQSEGSELADWNGRQVRIGGSMHEKVVQNIGANPVSMAYGETFEALQRNTINCSLGQLGVASLGVYEVAPNISYLTGDQSFTGRVGSAQVAGSIWDTLPLAYQQIIFDAETAHFEGKIRNTLDNMPLALEDAHAAGGDCYCNGRGSAGGNLYGPRRATG
jgi:TRAP-type C4-dicarboxylate transport system substrate-binding protein